MKNLKIHIALLSSIFCLIFSLSAQSKSLQNRLGVGYSNQLSNTVESISARYYPSEKLGFSLGLGLDTQENNSQFGLLVKVYRNIFPEDHMNFYMGAGAGLVSDKTSGVSDSGFELMAIIGGEFFIPGLDSLGFSFESGIGIVSSDSGVRFRTLAHSPLNAGIIFYF